MNTLKTLDGDLENCWNKEDQSDIVTEVIAHDRASLGLKRNKGGSEAS